MQFKPCANCGLPAHILSPARSERTRYCSRACRLAGLKTAAAAASARRKGLPGRKLSDEEKQCRRERYSMYGAANPMWRGGQHLMSTGYRATYVGREGGRTHYRLEHRLIAERVLGRRLRTDEVVHHIDLNRQNNAHNNLLICKQNYHVWLHNRMAQRWVEEHLGR